MDNQDNYYSTDWLASKTIYYNTRTKKVGSCINDVIDYNTVEWDPEGLYLYLKFGYAVLGTTPFKDVKFLLPNSSLSVKGGEIFIRQEQDDIPALLHQTTDEKDVLALLQQKISQWEREQKQPILIPTSGGFDSRILNVMIDNKSQIQSYTYGASKRQERSKEVVHAKLLSEKLGTKWERISIGHYHHFFNEWDNLYGPSVNCSGLYHYEFYDQIRRKNPHVTFSVLSGIIGDAWAGALNILPIDTVDDLLILGHTHGIRANEKFSKLKHENEVQVTYFEKNKEMLKDPLFRVVETMRFKLLFLSFLNEIPRSFGYVSWSPFLEKDIALGMLNIHAERRLERRWQRDYFRSKGILFEEMNLSWSRENSVNYQAICNVPLRPLNVTLLSEIIQEEYVEWINKTISSISSSRHMYQILMHTPYIKGGMKLIGFKNRLIEAYCAYMTIKPLETAILKRNKQ